MQHLSIDIETYSSVNLQKAGVYKYAESPDFDILLFGYSVDGGAVHVIDLACGEKIPTEIVDALSDESVTQWAFNAQFERVCLPNYLDTWLSPDSWHCTMVWSVTLGLPLSLEGVGTVWGLEKQNFPQNHMSDLVDARALVRSGNYDALELLYDDIPDTLSQLIRTAFVPQDGRKFIVADFSAIEARVLAWLAGEKWRMQVFADGKDIYCSSAVNR